MYSLEQSILRLTLIQGVGPGTIEILIQNGFADDQDALNGHLSVTELVHRYSISHKRAEILAEGLHSAAALEIELNLLAKHKIGWITHLDDHYPALLKNIHLPPPVLYWQGKLPTQDELCMAIVGSRLANRYAMQSLTPIISALVESNITIVSGGALGADSLAHSLTLDKGGNTVAVLGSGLLRPYPFQNKHLFARMIQEGGCIMSSFPLTFEPIQRNFPARNRIIAGLSRGCLVAQAAEKSGALITAHYALENGREVFAIPGPIDDPLSTGCHQLIQQGAQLVHEPADILRCLGIAPVRSNTTQANAPAPEKPDKHVSTVQTMNPGTEQPTTVAGKIQYACQKPCSTDDLLEHVDISFAELCATLCTLQLEGHLEQLPNGLWQAPQVR